MATTKFIIAVVHVLLFLLLQSSSSSSSSSSSVMTFVLEKDSNVTSFEELRARDAARHMRIFQRSIDHGVANFPVQGAVDDPYSSGIYFTRVKLGSPPKEYYLQIDTGGAALWVSCIPCTGCPITSRLGIQLGFFDPSNSASAAPVPCTDSICDAGSCSSTSRCSYSYGYGNGGISGYYLSDVLHYDRVTGHNLTVDSTNVIFGCTNYRSGYLTDSYRAVDGVFGLGPHRLSVISQLAAQGSAPKVFSHCLIGGGLGGGVLAFGKVELPGISYTPLHLPTRSHYSLDLESISINRKTVAIRPSVFATSSDRGTIVDSSTLWGCLTSDAYDPFVTALAAAIPSSVRQVSLKENQCFLAPSRDVFPLVSLHFVGGASMVLKPGEYLVQTLESLDMAFGTWCVGFRKCEGFTILGELMLKDKVIIYDLGLLRLGWVEYNCSLPVGVSSGSPSSSGDLVVVAVILYMLPFLFLCSLIN